VGIEPIAVQMSGGHLLAPVQKLVPTFIFAPTGQKCKSIPVPSLSVSQKYWVAAAKGKNGKHNASYKMQLSEHRQRW